MNGALSCMGNGKRLEKKTDEQVFLHSVGGGTECSSKPLASCGVQAWWWGSTGVRLRLFERGYQLTCPALCPVALPQVSGH